MARPSIFTPELAVEICTRLASGEGLRSICRDDQMPEKTTVLRWVMENREGFRIQYEAARAIQAEDFYDELMEIADDGSNDWLKVFDKKGNSRIVPDMEHIQRSRLRVDTRKWAMSKVLSKKYGDKIQAELTGAEGGPIQAEIKVEFVRTGDKK